ncbi:hypothetical protein EZV62_008421 [Acer yangbiense]|uniref:TF-B3 domain-containing protein n=1 Tax=Acer yangbiense TaxID=1000413 RepID=A0A5C7IFE0_9ROSI|nr:hypothetical protein EZV62_008421 [Acer yangbiense]
MISIAVGISWFGVIDELLLWFLLLLFVVLGVQRFVSVFALFLQLFVLPFAVFLCVRLPLIPNAFVTLCNRLMPKNAVLSNHMGSWWHVIVDYIDGRVYFLNGWKKFVKDNSIESGDKLIFRYNGQCGLSVKVFGQDACEKIENKANGTSYMNKQEKEEDSYMNKVKLEKGEVEKEKNEETKENDIEDKDCDDHGSNDSDYKDYIEVFEQMPVHKIGRGYKRTNDVSLEEVDVPKIILPQNPQFIAKLKVGSNRNLLFVPAEVLKLYQLKLQNLIFFRNKRGMHWPGEVINPRNNQIYIHGWNDFCTANHVSMDDWCICEFPQGNNQEANVIDVHIVCNTGEGTSRK